MAASTTTGGRQAMGGMRGEYVVREQHAQLFIMTYRLKTKEATCSYP